MKTGSKMVSVIAALSAVFVVLACQLKTAAGEERTDKTAVGIAPTPTPSPERDVITIAAVGDIMMGSPYPNDSRMPPNDGADLLKEVTPILSAADIAFGNLEGPITDGGVSQKCGHPKPDEPVRCFAFRVPTRYGKYLKAAGFDVMSVANNHAGDFGNIGRASTRKVLDEQGIKYAGSDRSQFSTAYLEVKGKRIAVIGFAHNNIVPNVNDLAAARQFVLNAKKKADIVIVSFHGGAEGTSQQHVPNQTEYYVGEKRGNLPAFAHTVIDAGADLVLGHGPHVMRGMELYKGRLIVYSLGNFCTYGWFKLEAETALTEIAEIKIGFDGKFIGGTIHAGRQEGWGGPTLDPTGEAIRVVRSLSEADFGANAPKIADDGTISAH